MNRAVFYLQLIKINLRKIETTKMTWLPMCGLVAQLVEHHTSIHGGNRVESH